MVEVRPRPPIVQISAPLEQSPLDAAVADINQETVRLEDPVRPEPIPVESSEHPGSSSLWSDAGDPLCGGGIDALQRHTTPYACNIKEVVGSSGSTMKRIRASLYANSALLRA
jgi:hypothetical protein